eukprot:13894998-Alexandrium_andersonii.AAC.1
MSASLVGSEMCIRDSASAVRSARTSPAAARRPNPSPAAATSWPTWPTTCLLYTSDAADDM